MVMISVKGISSLGLLTDYMMLCQFLRRVLEVNTELLNQMKELIIIRVDQLGRRNPTTSAPSEHGAGGLSEEPCRTTGSVFDGCVLDYHDTNAD